MFTLDCSNRWFKANQLVLNLMKTNIIKFSPSHFPQPQLITEHNNTTVSAVPNTKFLGVQIDDHLNWKCHVQQACQTEGHPRAIWVTFVLS
jgi:hypothetical protein